MANPDIFTLAMTYQMAEPFASYKGERSIEHVFNSFQYKKLEDERFEDCLTNYFVKEREGQYVVQWVNAPIFADGVYDSNKTITGRVKSHGETGDIRHFGYLITRVLEHARDVIEHAATDERWVEMTLTKTEEVEGSPVYSVTKLELIKNKKFVSSQVIETPSNVRFNLEE